jgi:hypothetical protein
MKYSAAETYNRKLYGSCCNESQLNRVGVSANGHAENAQNAIIGQEEIDKDA